MAHAVYIFNVVVIPRILYLMQIMEFSGSDMVIMLQFPMNKITKAKGGLPISLESAALHHQALIGLNCLEH